MTNKEAIKELSRTYSSFGGFSSFEVSDCSDSFLTKYNTPIISKEFMDAIIKQLSVKPTVEHKCHNCGGTVELDNDKHIFKCPYCNSVYAVGIQMINSI